MKKINIPEIIQKYGLDARQVATELFPSNKWPDSALARVIQKKTLLDEAQIARLAFLACTTIDSLYS
jgi:hypothetical protein